MTIDEVKTRKHDLEMRIRDVIDTFERDTDTTVTNITIERMVVKPVNDKFRNIVNEVEVEVKL